MYVNRSLELGKIEMIIKGVCLQQRKNLKKYTMPWCGRKHMKCSLLWHDHNCDQKTWLKSQSNRRGHDRSCRVNRYKVEDAAQPRWRGPDESLKSPIKTIKTINCTFSTLIEIHYKISWESRNGLVKYWDEII